MLARRKNAHWDGRFAGPGGHLEHGESFEDCAIREVKEETDLNIENPKFFGLTNDVLVLKKSITLLSL